MQRYFFHLDANGTTYHDDDGSDLASEEQARLEAMRALPEIAKDEVPLDGDRQAFTVLVTDELGRSVYSATLTYEGVWLKESDAPAE